jgi:hypothetical protein
VNTATVFDPAKNKLYIEKDLKKYFQIEEERSLRGGEEF